MSLVSFLQEVFSKKNIFQESFRKPAFKKETDLLGKDCFWKKRGCNIFWTPFRRNKPFVEIVSFDAGLWKGNFHGDGAFKKRRYNQKWNVPFDSKDVLLGCRLIKDKPQERWNFLCRGCQDELDWLEVWHLKQRRPTQKPTKQYLSELLWSQLGNFWFWFSSCIICRLIRNLPGVLSILQWACFIANTLTAGINISPSKVSYFLQTYSSRRTVLFLASYPCHFSNSKTLVSEPGHLYFVPIAIACGIESGRRFRWFQSLKRRRVFRKQRMHRTCRTMAPGMWDLCPFRCSYNK